MKQTVYVYFVLSQLYLQNLGFVTQLLKDGIIDDFPDPVWLGAGGDGRAGHSR